ncbi:FAD-binding oxidoreductase [Alcanivorax sp. 1008]|uniref:FAD-binding oxidoreductase n=1 Tax=Alcanivorax sp. 1008 TaxID=2816853 RepID=UPI001DC475D6|nr:FAD-binding oxidoreductase [Alcanivorax sp. 1008]MCC1496246.1 FAD-binding oxidoreductase [Alcanivorax sp. 1008]
MSAVADLFRPLLGARCLTDEDSLKRYGVDWTKVWAPAPSAVLLPESTEEVQAIVRLANEHRIALVPSGGRTGLSAAAVAADGEVVVAFDRMNKVLDFSPFDRAVTVQPGVITQQLQEFAEQQGLFYPVDFASAGSSNIGGNIGTNAGGIKVIRYGMTRDWITGLKVVTGKGELLDLNKGLAKNATGYDFRHLMIGSEGTLGFVVEATVKLARQPDNLTVLVLGAPGFREVMRILHAFQSKIDLTAFEFFSDKAMSHVLAHGVARPFDGEAPFYCLLEFEGSSDGVMNDAMALFEDCVEKGWVLDGVMSQSLTQASQLWQLRERISESISIYTPYKNDISVTVAKVPDFVEEVDAIVQANYPDFEIVWFGHIGDGNMHLNILKPADLPKEEFFARCNNVSKWVFEIVEKYNGSISAEHGVGRTKKAYLGYSRSPEEIALMKAVKAAFDPNGIMNPGKIFDL